MCRGLRIICVAIFVVSVLLVPCFAEITSAENMLLEGNEILELLDELGCYLDGINMMGWAKANADFTDLKNLEDIARMSCKAFNPCVITSFTSEENNHVRQARIGFVYEGMDVRIILNNGLKPPMNSEYETYIVIEADIKGDDILNRSERLRDKINEYFGVYSNDFQLATTYISSIPGEMGNKEMKRLGNQLIQSLNGSFVEGLQEEGLISQTGYTPRFDRFLEVNYQKINVNIALRYNAYMNKTYIWLGTPLITAEY